MHIRTEHLTKQVEVEGQPLTILQDVSLNIESGQTVAIVGVSGSGKSTLLGLLAGLDLPTSGIVQLDKINLNNLNENERAQIRAKNIGFIFQNFQLLTNLTALENVMLPLELNGIKEPEIKAKELLERVGLSARLQHYPRQLSGGEQQRVSIARAFVVQPRLLFADEPTGNLDQRTASHVIHLLFELNQQFQTTLICATHDPVLGGRCQRILHLEGGQLIS